MLISERIESFTLLGDWMKAQLERQAEGVENGLSDVMLKAEQQNPWFTQSSLTDSLSSIVSWLNAKTLNNWAQHYHLTEPAKSHRVAVIMAGNIPLVNFHDFLGVLITGHQFLGKLSSQDKVLLPFLADKLIELNPNWRPGIQFTEQMLAEFDAVIATGSNNSSRYFHHYFGKYPNIIRKNRNSIAVIGGNESAEDLKLLYSDIFQYYGMGCRNVSFLLVPKGYDFPGMFDTWQGLPDPTDHYKYKNNYDYYRSIYLINSQRFLDTGYVSVLESNSIASPLSVVHFYEYQDKEEVQAFIHQNQSEIQCVVSKDPIKEVLVIQPGQAQCPSIMDYPDGVDIIQFLLAL